MGSRLKWSKRNTIEAARDFSQRRASKYLYSEVKPLTQEERDKKHKELLDKKVKQLEDELDGLTHNEVEGD